MLWEETPLPTIHKGINSQKTPYQNGFVLGLYKEGECMNCHFSFHTECGPETVIQTSKY